MFRFDSTGRLQRSAAFAAKKLFETAASGFTSKQLIIRIRRTYPCRLCEKVYGRLDNLTRHVRSRHRNQDPDIGGVMNVGAVRENGAFPSPSTPTQDELEDVVVPVLPVVASGQRSAVGIMPSKLPVPVRPSKRPSLDERLNRMELEWAEPQVASTYHSQKPRAFSLKTWDPPASERALAAEMVGGVVRSVLSAPRGESLLTQKKRSAPDVSSFRFRRRVGGTGCRGRPFGCPGSVPAASTSGGEDGSYCRRRPRCNHGLFRRDLMEEEDCNADESLVTASTSFKESCRQRLDVVGWNTTVFRKKIETRSSSGKPAQAPKRVSRASGKAPDSDVQPDLASTVSTAPVAQSVSSVPGEQYPFLPYIDGELDRILQETDACLDGAMDVGAASAVQVVAEMSFRPLIADGDYVELQPLADE